MSDNINNALVGIMFKTLQNAEQKNVRTAQYDNKEMVKILTDHIFKESNKASKTGDDKV